MKKDKITFEKIVLNHETGEVLSEEKVIIKDQEPNFIKIYLDCLLNFKELSKTLNPILLECLKHMSYANTDDLEGGQIIFINAELKRRIAAKTEKTVKRVEQALTDFVRHNIFKRIAVGTYQVNPNYFGKGNWSDIHNIRAKFDFKNNVIETEIE